jgi:hypothetical protein
VGSAGCDVPIRRDAFQDSSSSCLQRRWRRSVVPWTGLPQLWWQGKTPFETVGCRFGPCGKRTHCSSSPGCSTWNRDLQQLSESRSCVRPMDHPQPAGPSAFGPRRATWYPRTVRACSRQDAPVRAICWRYCCMFHVERTAGAATRVGCRHGKHRALGAAGPLGCAHPGLPPQPRLAFRTRGTAIPAHPRIGATRATASGLGTATPSPGCREWRWTTWPGDRTRTS